MGRPSNTEERRAQIVEAFLTVISKEGYARATIAAVAREAGLTSGLLHYHFGRKHQLLVARAQLLGGRGDVGFAHLGDDRLGGGLRRGGLIAPSGGERDDADHQRDRDDRDGERRNAA